jgi:hypothetical protein
VSDRGGGMYLRVEKEGMSLCLSGLVFDENEAFMGRDIYLECDDLTKRVNPTSFLFYKEKANEEKPLYGKDVSHFKGDVDLFIFLVGYKGDVAYVSSKEKGGRDEMYCGVVEFKCLTFIVSTNHLKESEKECI